jgi:hypothetical protein
MTYSNLVRPSYSSVAQKILSRHTGYICMPARIFGPIHSPREFTAGHVDATKLSCEVAAVATHSRIYQNLKDLFALQIRPTEIITAHPDQFTITYQQNPTNGANEAMIKVVEQYKSLSGPISVIARFIPTNKVTAFAIPDHFSVVVTESAPDLQKWIQEYVYNRKETFIGIDCEWDMKQILRLTQISTASSCILLRTMTDRPLPPSLISLLNDPNVKKIWTDFTGDKKILESYVFNFHDQPFHFNHSSWVDLENNRKEKHGIKAMMMYHLGMFMEKDQARTNWARRQLTSKQERYAVLDAYANYVLYKHLQETNKPFALNDDFMIT